MLNRRDSMIRLGQFGLGALTLPALGAAEQACASALSPARTPGKAKSCILLFMWGGPAHQAGILPGDVLTAVAGKPVATTTDMLNTIAQLPPGRKASVTIVRRNRETTFDVMVGLRPLPVADEQ